MKLLFTLLISSFCFSITILSKPNFLFIVSDDLNTRIGPYVDASLKIHTPNLDRLASEGVSFNRAYCQYPVCGPSRASFMSGLYPETNGVTDNAFDTGNHRVATPSLATHPTIAGFFRPHVPLIAPQRHFSHYPDEDVLLSNDSINDLEDVPENAPFKTNSNQTAYTITRPTQGAGASLRTDRWRYNRWGNEANGDNEELYDHHNDPAEHTNLARDPAHLANLTKLRNLFEKARTRARN